MLVDQDVMLKDEVFQDISDVLAFDLVFRTGSADFSGMRVIFYSFKLKEFRMLRFTSAVVFSVDSIARSDLDFIGINCSDEFVVNLTCLVTKSSGEQCLLEITVEVNGPSRPAKLDCRFAPFKDFDSRFTQVVEKYIIQAGQELTSPKKQILIYKSNNLSYPLFPSGSQELGYFDISSENITTLIGMRDVLGVDICLTFISKFQLTIYQLQNLSFTVGSSATYQVVLSESGTLEQQIQLLFFAFEQRHDLTRRHLPREEQHICQILAALVARCSGHHLCRVRRQLLLPRRPQTRRRRRSFGGV
jgi:hypothetical protein